MADNGNTSTAKQDGAKDEGVTVAVQGVSSVSASDSGGQSSVETRSDAGGETPADSPLQTARKLLSKVVRWVRKVLRIDP